MVSVAAARALTETTVPQLRHPAHVCEVPADNDAVYVLPSEAAKQVGVPGWQVPNWRKQGKVACKHGLYGQLVRLADVQVLAAQAPRQPAAQRAEDAGESRE
jgi:hypothetical protein